MLSDNAQIKHDIEQVKQDLENIRNSANYQAPVEEEVENPEVVTVSTEDNNGEDDGNPVQDYAETVEREEIEQTNQIFFHMRII